MSALVERQGLCDVILQGVTAVELEVFCHCGSLSRRGLARHARRSRKHCPWVNWLISARQRRLWLLDVACFSSALSMDGIKSMGSPQSWHVR